MNKNCFDLACRRCDRLSDFLDDVKVKYPEYHARPVAPFGDKNAKLLVVGLAPGMHGANATGRPFTGDFAGILLYETLFKFGFSNQSESTDRKDGLELINCRITNAVKCLPPENKPLTSEVNECNTFLENELKLLKAGSVIIALGGIAHKAVIKAMQLRQSDFKFAHNAQFKLENDITFISSYHCSRYNTQTKRLTPKMFHAVFKKAQTLLN